jgi:hypothetical protein
MINKMKRQTNHTLSPRDTFLSSICVPLQAPYTSSDPLYTPKDRADATIFIAVQDPNYDLIQLQVADGSGDVFIAEAGQTNTDYSSDDNAFSFLYPGAPSSCGSAGSAPGQADGAGALMENPCETYVFFSGTDSMYTVASPEYDFYSEWINPGQGYPAEYLWLNCAGTIFQAVDESFFSGSCGGQLDLVSLYYPA